MEQKLSMKNIKGDRRAIIDADAKKVLCITEEGLVEKVDISQMSLKDAYKFAFGKECASKTTNKDNGMSL